MDDELLIRDRIELDALLVNLEAAVRVRRRSDFFSWVQGVFQSLLAHDVLICAIADPRSRAYNMEWMSTHPIDTQRLQELCNSSDGLVYRLMTLWEAAGKQPLLIDGRPKNEDEGDSTIADEITRLGLQNVAAHGMPDVDGNACTFFCFSKVSSGPRRQVAARLELVAPYLHLAWLRALGDPGQEPVNRIRIREMLTVREIEILRWVEQGKSNNEIAALLGISPLTVKNHVQKILRKLSVSNRAQAVAKGISLKLTSTGMR